MARTIAGKRLGASEDIRSVPLRQMRATLMDFETSLCHTTMRTRSLSNDLQMMYETLAQDMA